MTANKLEYNIITIQMPELSVELKESYLDLQEALHAISKRGDILRTRNYRKMRLNEPTGQRVVWMRYFAVMDRRVIGHGNARHTQDEEDSNPESIELNITVHPDYRRQGVGSALMEQLETYAKSVGRTKYEAWFAPVDGPEGATFASKFGLQKVSEETVSRLYRDKINWDFIREQKSKGKETLGRYQYIRLDRYEWADKILAEDGFADEMADFYNEVTWLIPKDDIDMEPNRETGKDLQKTARHIKETSSSDGRNFYAMDGDRIVAMSGTYFPNDPPIRDVGTGLTGVRKAYQRQGLATLLKIMVIEAFVDEFPEFEYIYTENAASNQGMLSINNNLGFEPVYSWEMWQKK